MIEHLHRVAAHAYYCGEHDAGRRACERLMRLPLSPEKEEKVRANRTWYTQTLVAVADATFQRIEVEPAAPSWSLFNPSIVRHGHDLVVNVRSSNYRIVDGRYVMPPEDGETIKTRNIVVNPENGERREIVCDYASTGFPVTGLEDVRLNSVDGCVFASATVRDLQPHDGTCRIGYGPVIDGRIESLICHDTKAGVHEKNWMPITGRREWLYSCHANGRVCTVADTGSEWTVTAHAASPLVARGFRGGSQLVPVGDGRWIAIVHEVAHSSGRRVYEHRVVEFDEGKGWAIVGVSRPFAFLSPRTIEFCAGLAIDGDDLVASFGVNDAEAWLARVPLDQVLGMLEEAE